MPPWRGHHAGIQGIPWAGCHLDPKYTQLKPLAHALRILPAWKTPRACPRQMAVDSAWTATGAVQTAKQPSQGGASFIAARLGATGFAGFRCAVAAARRNIVAVAAPVTWAASTQLAASRK